MSRIVELARKTVSFTHGVAVRAAFVLISRLTPVRNDYWCFCTWEGYPHTLDNPRAVFEEIKNDPGVQKIILQKSRSTPVAVEGCRVVFVSAESLLGAYYFARSRVIVSGYALRGISSYSSRLRDKRHELIQLWHGIPLKRIGRLFPGEEWWSKETRHYSAVVCSSERDRTNMAQAFAPVQSERVWLTGLPRNSLILKEEGQLPADYRADLRRLDGLAAGRRLVVYAPTWREKLDDLYSFTALEQAELQRVMRRHNAVLGIRGHANVRHGNIYQDVRDGCSIISLNSFADANLILRRADVLVTDYSSIYIDFLLANRPVIHFAYDLEAYASERGFLYAVDEAFAGGCCGTFDGLLVELESALADPAYELAKRSRAMQMFHTHASDSAAAVRDRILDLISSPSTELVPHEAHHHVRHV